MLIDRARAIQRVCFDLEPNEADLEILGSPERWLVYRDLVRNRLVGVIEAALPRTRASIGDDEFRRAFDRWLSSGGPTTRYFRKVPNELVGFSLDLWRETEAPWVADLARYEITAWSVRHAPPDPKDVAEFTFERRPVVGSAVEVLRLEHPVHETPTPDDGYEPAPTILCLHRNDRHRAVPRLLNPLAADLLEAWQRSEETVAESVHRIAGAHETEISPVFVDKLSTLITDFLTQRILVGGRPTSTEPPA